jgi:hypothetical protein
VNKDVPVQPVHTPLCLILGGCPLAYSSAMKMEAVRFCETSMKFCPTTHLYISDDNSLHIQHCENSVSSTCIFFSAEYVHINVIGHVNITCRADLFLKETNSYAVPYTSTERCGRSIEVAALTRRTVISTHISHDFS